MTDVTRLLGAANRGDQQAAVRAARDREAVRVRVLLADQVLRARVHRVCVQRHMHMPGKPGIDCQRCAAVDDLIAIGAADRAEPRLEIRAHSFGRQYGDAMPAEPEMRTPGTNGRFAALNPRLAR